MVERKDIMEWDVSHGKFPQEGSGDTVCLLTIDGVPKIELFIDFSDDKGEYPQLTIEQAKALEWALKNAIREAERLLMKG